MYAIWSRWAPPMERASLVTIPHSGKYLENDSYEFVISLILCFNCSLYELSTIPNVPYKRVRIDVLLHANCSYCTYVLSSCLVIYCCIFFFVVYNKTYIICIISLILDLLTLKVKYSTPLCVVEYHTPRVELQYLMKCCAISVY